MKTKKLVVSLLIVVILLLSIGSILYKKSAAGDKPGIANIYQDGVLIKSIPLTKTLTDSFTIEGTDGAYNHIEIADGHIAVTSASCPDLICVHQGAINNDLIPITCLPNRLIIAIEYETDTDIIAY